MRMLCQIHINFLMRQGSKGNAVKECLFRLKIQQPKNCTLSNYGLQLIFNKNIIDGSKIRFSVQYTWQIFGLQGFRLVNRLRSYSQDAIPVNQNFVMSTEQRNLL